MRWAQLVFVHWRVDPERVRQRLPHGIDLDLFHGAAYVSLVALQATGPLPQPLLDAMGPLAHYRQLNIRTYVVGENGPGIYLLDTRVDRAFPLAARLVGMPYHLDSSLAIDEREGVYHVRAALEPPLSIDLALLADMPHVAVDPHGLGDFVLNRFRNYAELPGGLLYCVEIAHAPWHVRPLLVLGEPPPAPLGLGDDGPVATNFADEVEVGLTHFERPDANV